MRHNYLIAKLVVLCNLQFEVPAAGQCANAVSSPNRRWPKSGATIPRHGNRSTNATSRGKFHAPTTTKQSLHPRTLCSFIRQWPIFHILRNEKLSIFMVYTLFSSSETKVQSPAFFKSTHGTHCPVYIHVLDQLAVHQNEMIEC